MCVSADVHLLESRIGLKSPVEVVRGLGDECGSFVGIEPYQGFSDSDVEQ